MFEGAADESGDRAWIRRQEQKTQNTEQMKS